MRVALVLVALVACDAEAREPNAPPPSAPPPSAPSPSPARPVTAPTVSTFQPLAKDARLAAATAIAARFPAAQAPQVEIDFAGFPSTVRLTLPAPVAREDRVPRALAFVREHAATFGVLDARDLPYQLDGDMIRIGAGRRWTGQIVVRFDGPVMTIYDHLWPIATERIDRSAAALEALVAPYYGRHGQFRSRCTKDCGKTDSNFVLDRQSFGFTSGMAFVCTPTGVVVRAAISIDRHYRPGSRVEGIEKLPTLVDARTLAPIEGTWFIAPGGTATEIGVTLTSQVGFDSYGPCFGS